MARSKGGGFNSHADKVYKALTSYKSRDFKTFFSKPMLAQPKENIGTFKEFINFQGL